MKKSFKLSVILIVFLMLLVACKDVEYTQEVASVNGVIYSSLQEAIRNASEGDTVELLSDVIGTGAYIDKDITVDFKGFTYTLKDRVDVGYKLGASEVGIVIDSTVTLANATIQAGEGFTRSLIESYGELTVENSTIIPAENQVAIDLVCGSVKIEESYVTGVIKVEGGTVKFDTAPEDVVFTGAVEDSVFYGDTTATDIIDAVAVIGKVSYASLEEAVTSATDDDTITLTNNVDLTSTLEISKNMTLDLNGHNVSASGVRAIQVMENELVITGSGNIEVTEMSNEDSSVIRVGQNANKAAKLTIDQNVTVTTIKGYGISIFNGASGNSATEEVELVIKGTVSSTNRPAISGVGNIHNGTTNIIIDTTATVSTTEENAIYFPCAGTLTINGHVEGKGGIEMKSGSASVIGETAVIKATEETTATSVNNNGCSTSGYAVAVVENAGYKGQPKIEIKGGTITGPIAIVKDNDVEEGKEGSISITGGTFSSDPSGYVANGYKATKSGNVWVVGK